MPPQRRAPLPFPGRRRAGGRVARGHGDAHPPCGVALPPPPPPGQERGRSPGAAGGREGAGPRRGYFERRQPAQRVPLPFLGLGLAGQVTGAESLAPTGPFPAAGRGRCSLRRWERCGTNSLAGSGWRARPGLFWERLSWCLCSSSSASLGCAVQCH